MSELVGKRIVIPAAARGLGRVMAETLTAEGARVHICDIDEAALASFRERHPGIGTTLADVAREEDVERLFADVESQLGGLDVLVNNAGIAGPTGPVETLDYDAWMRCLEVNLGGAFLCTRRAVPLLAQAGGGLILNISSTAGLFGFPNRTPYVSSKWGLIGFTKTLAMELGPRGIRANAICPGPVEGDRIERVIRADAEVTGRTVEETREAYLRTNSLRTFIAPEDIANLVLFLCSPRAARINGQVIAVDGHTESLRTS